MFRISEIEEVNGHKVKKGEVQPYRLKQKQPSLKND
jgi:hypothetical protein